MYYTPKKGRQKINGALYQLMSLSTTLEASRDAENHRTLIAQLDSISHNLRILSEDTHGLVLEIAGQFKIPPTKKWSKPIQSAFDRRKI